MRPNVYSMFSGIGGIDLGLKHAGFDVVRLVEWAQGPRAVLAARFPEATLGSDVSQEQSIPSGVALVTAGFPCKDISPLGGCSGLEGCKSSLVWEMFRLLAKHDVPTVLVENVTNMLRLKGGAVMEAVLTAFEQLGYSWAYRVVDTRAFGIPHRRERVVIVAMLEGDPRRVLLADDAEPYVEPPTKDWRRYATCFLPHMGGTGMGLAIDCSPTIVCGTARDAVSQPAVIMFGRELLRFHIHDGERLQGFPVGWTEPAGSLGKRWTAVGNSVSVPVSAWVGRRLRHPDKVNNALSAPLVRHEGSWPKAAWCYQGERATHSVGTFPVREPYVHLADFLEYTDEAPSRRAITGFLRRFHRHERLHPPAGFIALLEKYVKS